MHGGLSLLGRAYRQQFSCKRNSLFGVRPLNQSAAGEIARSAAQARNFFQDLFEKRAHKLRSDTSNKRDSCKLKSLAPLHNPSLPIISDLTTQKERKLNSQLFLLNAQGGRAVMVLGTGACRTEISSVRTVLLGGGLENRLV